jgi:membrane-bound serine protease (ClpP class)
MKYCFSHTLSTVRNLHALVFSMVFAFSSIGARAQDEGSAASSESSSKTVFVLPLQGAIDQALMILYRRAFSEVEEMKPDLVVIDIDTPGGRLLETEEIIAWMRSVDTPIYAYVNTHAQSAGAIISFGSDKIFMAPGSRIGSALPIIMGSGGVADLPEKVYEKLLSDTRALVRGVAEENGHNPDVAVAMVDPAEKVVIGERVVCDEGELLNLTAREAVEIIPPQTTPLLAEAIVDDLDALLDYVGLSDAQVIRFAPEPAEDLARWIVKIGPILFALGLIGIYLEIKTPGIGLPGIAGATCLIIYFFGHHVAGLAGVEELVLVLVGLILIALEIFVIPGFGIAGVLGIIAVFAGMFLGLVPHIPEIPTTLPGIDAPGIAEYLPQIAQKIIFTMVLVIGGVYLLAKLLPKTSVYGHLVLQAELSKDKGYVSSDSHYNDFLGKTGIARTDLHPSGIAMFDDERLDVVTTGDMIEKDAEIKVVQVQGGRIVVEKA